MPQIVDVIVSQTSAPAPSRLQQTGALVSCGGTTKTAGSLTLLTGSTGLSAILSVAKAITSMTWTSGVVTVTTAAPHGYAVGSTPVRFQIAGAVPAGYNGNYSCTITGASTFTFPLATNPGAETTPGTYLPQSQVELQQMVGTFFTQTGPLLGVYVLELGTVSPGADGVAALQAFMAANPATIYSYLFPRDWGQAASLPSIAANYSTPTSRTYFWVTCYPASNYLNFTSSMKAVIPFVDAPGLSYNLPATEFSLAAPFFTSLNWNPTGTSQVPPLNNSYTYGTTPYPTVNNAAILATYDTAGVSYIGTGAQGGLSGTLMVNGETADGQPFNYWYATDWLAINVAQALSAAIINGANNPQAPLYYNQAGINQLQQVAGQVCSQGISYGLFLGQLVLTQLPAATFRTNFNAGLYTGQLVLNADPFGDYITNNPSAYAAGQYGGFSCVATPLRGFGQILFYLDVTNFA